jgi:septum formation topological specificity factor MinE
MGDRLARGFLAAQEAGGERARRRLALRLGLTAAAARAAPDRPEELARMREALRAVIKREVAL